RLCRPRFDPRRLLPGRAHRRGIALGCLPPHPASEDGARAHHRSAAALHGFVHDLHRALRRHRRRAGQFHHLPVDRPRADGDRPVRSRPGRGDVADLLPDHPRPVMGVLRGDDTRGCGAEACPESRQGGSAMTKRRFSWIVPTIYILFLLVPIYWLVNMSFKTNAEITSGVSLWPAEPTLRNYMVIFT